MGSLSLLDFPLIPYQHGIGGTQSKTLTQLTKKTYQEANFIFVTFNVEIYLILNVLMFLVCSLGQS